MNILQINSIDSRGGAAKVASRLGDQLQKDQHEVNYLVGHKIGSANNVKELAYPVVARTRNHKFRLHGAFLPTISCLEENNYYRSAEILHLHNLHLEPDGYFNVRDLPRLSQRKPIVWTIHDPWLIYERGQTSEYDYFFNKIPGWYNYLKRHSVNAADLTIISPSQWLADLVAKFYPGEKIKVIPNGVDTAIFKPLDREAARRKLGFEANQKIVLFVANEGEANGPKGSEFLKAAESKLTGKNFKFISLGSSSQKSYIEDEAQLAAYYNAADLFALPSLAENLPLTVLEAMACGAPAVVFDTGGLKEIISHQVNGYLAKYKDKDDFIAGIKWLLGSGPQIRTAARKTIEEGFTLRQMVKKYGDLYADLLSDSALK